MTKTNRKRGHVLVVEDDIPTATALGQYLRQHGYEATVAHSVSFALAEIGKRLPDIVLLDLVMPDIGGMELLAELRLDPATQSLPVIVTSALGDTEDIVSAIRAGANDYITKPLDLSVLMARLERHLEIAASIISLERQSHMRWQMDLTDEQTGVCNHLYLLQTLQMEVLRSLRYGNPLSILLVELDDFAGLSTRHGAQAVDGLLRQFADGLSCALRRSDKLSRCGNAQFCSILTQTSHHGAMSAADNLRAWANRGEFKLPSSDEIVRLSVSIGVASLGYSTLHDSAEELLEEGTNALHQAQRRGTEQIFSFEAAPANTEFITPSS